MPDGKLDPLATTMVHGSLVPVKLLGALKLMDAVLVLFGFESRPYTNAALGADAWR